MSSPRPYTYILTCDQTGEKYIGSRKISLMSHFGVKLLNRNSIEEQRGVYDVSWKPLFNLTMLGNVK
jgi:hypothetical protein